MGYQDLNGCNCSCDFGYDGADCSMLLPCECHDLTKNECSTAPHCEGQCYWHDDVTGCLEEDEYVNSISTVINYDPSACMENSEVEIFTRLYFYGNLGSTDITIEDLGFEVDYEKINSYSDSESTLSKDGATINFEEFNEMANNNKNQRIQSVDTGRETTKETSQTHTVEAEIEWKKKFFFGEVSAGLSYGFEHEGVNIEVDSSQASSRNTIEGSTSSTDSITENLENFWAQDTSAEISTSFQERETFTMKCAMESLILEPLKLKVVKFSYNKGSLRCHVTSVLEISTNKGTTIFADFESNIQSVSYSTCSGVRSSSFITKDFDCQSVLNAGMSLSSRDVYSAQCTEPPNLYNPLQRSVSAKWCSSMNGEMVEHTYEELDLAETQMFTVSSGDHLVEVFDDNTHLDCAFVLADEDICRYHDVIDSNSTQVGLLDYHIPELAEAGRYTEMLGYMKILKFVIPPRAEKLVSLTADDFEVVGLIRDGDGCPGYAIDDHEPSKIFNITNESYEDKIFWVVVSTDIRVSDKYFWVEVFSRTLNIAEEAESDVCNKNIIWNELDDYPWGCGFYSYGNNNLFCKYDSTEIDGTIYRATSVCQECGCCPEDRPRDCNGYCGGTAVADCLGVCNGDAVVDKCGECGGTSTCEYVSIKGSVNGLSHSALLMLLVDDDHESMIIVSEGQTAFVFSMEIQVGKSYSVSIYDLVSEYMDCKIFNGAGIASTEVIDDVILFCFKCDVPVDCLGICHGNSDIDCMGVCGGTAEVDDCGVCNGGGVPDWACNCALDTVDCAGKCGGELIRDLCDICGGDGTSCASLVAVDVNLVHNSKQLLLKDYSAGAQEDFILTVSKNGVYGFDAMVSGEFSLSVIGSLNSQLYFPCKQYIFAGETCTICPSESFEVTKVTPGLNVEHFFTLTCVEAPINGGWGNWSEWGVCNHNTGLRTKTRRCDTPAPSNGGADCRGSSTHTAKCDEEQCDPSVDSENCVCHNISADGADDVDPDA